MIKAKPLFRIDLHGCLHPHTNLLPSLQACYHRLSPGGIVLIDDWHLFGARAAVHEFRKALGITETVSPLTPLPSDYIYGCQAPTAGLHRCGVKRGEPLQAAIGGRSKHLFYGVYPHVVWWAKALR
jgi:SAM-dependent methyltransferase